METNEGNEQLVTSIPKIHIVVMEVEEDSGYCGGGCTPNQSPSDELYWPAAQQLCLIHQRRTCNEILPKI
jgi:hypothetical protein